MLRKEISGGVTSDIEMDKGTAVLKFSTYGSLDRDGDRSNKGMFKKSWSEGFKDIKFLLNHEPRNPLGAPGKPIEFWEKDDGAYCLVKFGTNTLGQDCLKMVDEQIIDSNSFGFDVVKSKQIKDKGKDFLEVKQWELSILTGWPAHPGSTVQTVKKSFMNLKTLTDREQSVLQQIIYNGNDNLAALVTLSGELDVDSDLYSAVNWYISEQSRWIADAKSNLRYGRKDADMIVNLKTFLRNSSASDETLAQIDAYIKSVETSTTDDDDTATTTPLIKEPGASVDEVKEFTDFLHLLTLKM